VLIICKNLLAAKLVCEKLGIAEKDFLHAISSFKGASKRLEKVFESGDATLYRDFAHAPSKVKASIHAVKEQFPGRKLTAVLELHTYSSLNARFLPEYHDAMQEADTAVVFFSSHALSNQAFARSVL
jgi:UDP-N-acetylmuramate: L-alanyl-gamma-D-glutamyl-meso-diaminopimelate ligase